MRTSTNRRAILTAPNAVSVFGFVLVLIGCSRLNTWDGFGFVIIGRLLDVLDGWIARKYHQTSQLGAILDATLDKLALLVITSAAWYFEMAPVAALAAIIGINIVVTAVTYVAARRHPQATLSVSRSGKYAMALQNASLAMYIASQLMTSNSTLASYLWNAGHVAIFLGTAVFGLWAVYGYVRRAIQPA